nr:immunoglobulin light chain junction region [Macaca mulatta]
CLQFHSHPWTF